MEASISRNEPAAFINMFSGWQRLFSSACPILSPLLETKYLQGLEGKHLGVAHKE